MTKHTAITVTLLVLLALAVASAEPKYILNYHRLSTREVGISCANGGDPAGTKVGDTLIISCGGDK